MKIHKSLAATRLGPAIALLILVGGCSANPVTGRREVVLMSTEEEIELGERAAREVGATMGLARAPALAAYVDELGQRLAAHSPRRDVSYTFDIVDMPEANAFALPGGHVYVSRGLLAISNSEDELANVIAHEIGHVAARHHAQQQTRAAGVGILTFPSRLVGAIVGGVVGSIVEAPFQALGTGLIAAYGRDQEREADRIALQISAAAGYDPEALARFLDTLERETLLRNDGEEHGPSFFETHPSTPERVKNTALHARGIEWTRTAGLTDGRADYLRKLDGLLLGHNSAEGVFRDELFLHPDFDIALQFPEKWKTVNAHSAVFARSPDMKAQITVTLQDGYASPKEAAEAFFAEASKASVEVGDSESLEINGLPTYRCTAAVRDSSGLIYLDLTWIAHRGHIFRLVGVSSPRSFDEHRFALVETVSSFRPLNAVERGSIEDTRLRSKTALPGESLEAFGTRTQNTWSVEETAVANALPRDELLTAGAPIKVAVSEPHPALDEAPLHEEEREETAPGEHELAK